jgi:hypothetical protein
MRKLDLADFIWSDGSAVLCDLYVELFVREAGTSILYGTGIGVYVQINTVGSAVYDSW